MTGKASAPFLATLAGAQLGALSGALLDAVSGRARAVLARPPGHAPGALSVRRPANSTY